MRFIGIVLLWIPLAITSISLVACGGTNQRTPIQRGNGGGGDNSNGTLGKVTLTKCGDNQKEILNIHDLVQRLAVLDTDPAKSYIRDMAAYPISATDQIPDIRVNESDDRVHSAAFLNRTAYGSEDLNMLDLQVSRMSEILSENSAFRIKESASSDCSKIQIGFKNDFIGFDAIQSSAPTTLSDETDVEKLKEMVEALQRNQDEEPVEPAVEDEDEDDQNQSLEDETTYVEAEEKVVNFEVSLERSSRNQLVLKAENQDFWLVYSVSYRKKNEEIAIRAMLPSATNSCIEGELVKPFILDYTKVISWNNYVVNLTRPFLAKIEDHLIDKRDLEHIEKAGDLIDLGLDTADILAKKTIQDVQPTCLTEPES